MRTFRTLTGIAVLIAGMVSASTQAADPKPHSGRPPSSGTGATGGTGAKTLHEGTRAGAPGSLVTAAEGTVLEGHDQDSDGFISKAEANKNGSLSKQFAQLDVNHDGKLDRTEFQNFQPEESAATGTAPTTPSDAENQKKK